MQKHRGSKTENLTPFYYRNKPTSPIPTPSTPPTAGTLPTPLSAPALLVALAALPLAVPMAVVFTSAVAVAGATPPLQYLTESEEMGRTFQAVSWVAQ